MTSGARLSRSTVSPENLILKNTPLVTGIVHIGLGNFHRAHLAVYTALAMEEAGGNWGISAYSMRNTSLVEAMNAQDCLYSVLEIGPNTEKVVIPGIHTGAHVGTQGAVQIIDQIAEQATKIVSLTVTEAGYYISQTTRGLDIEHPDIQNDLELGVPKTIYGLLAQGFIKRIAAGSSPISVLSCDNISENGRKCQLLLHQFISHLPQSSELEKFLLESTTFPNSMVDRIVPGTELRHLDMAFERLALIDQIPVPAEEFTMWALEDDFAAGRPAWELAGVIFTPDVEKFEVMKLRLLNGAHSLLAYLGALSGHETIPASRFDPLIEKVLTQALYQEYLPSFEIPEAIDADSYIQQLFSRWSNTVLGDKTSRVGTDGSTKLPQRITTPALEAIKLGREPKTLALTVAAWIMCIAPFGDFISGKIADEMKDPAKQKLIEIAARSATIEEYAATFFAESGVFSSELAQSEIFITLVTKYMELIYLQGITKAIESCVN